MFFFGHLDEQVQRVDQRVERMEPKLDDVREQVAYIKGQISEPAYRHRRSLPPSYLGRRIREG